MSKMIKQILASCLKEKADGYVINALLTEFPTIQDLLNTNEKEIQLIKGIGAAKAKQLHAIFDLVKAVNSSSSIEHVIIHSPQDVYKLVRGEMEYLQVEHFDILGLSTKNHVLFKENISAGILNASIVHPRETFRPLIKRACASCILLHNHPSGNPGPSIEDIHLTKKLVDVGKIMDIPVLDHVIIGRGSYVSLKEKGVL